MDDGVLTLRPIARIRSDFATKFGIPRQSGLVEALSADLVFEPPYRSVDALRGIADFSHLWLIWEFSAAVRSGWSPTVRPPRLGGNARMGVFATRSPFRPNPLGLSCVRLTGVSLDTPQGPVLHVAGADLMDGTPIYDIKPYLVYGDCKPDATGGFTDAVPRRTLRVELPDALARVLAPGQRDALTGVLAQDPRPSYQKDAARMYGFRFAQWEIRFSVADDVLTVHSIEAARI